MSRTEDYIRKMTSTERKKWGVPEDGNQYFIREVPAPDRPERPKKKITPRVPVPKGVRRKKVQRAAAGGEIQGYKCGGKVTARSKKSAKKGFKGTY